MTDELLAEAEHEIITLLGRAYTMFRKEVVQCDPLPEPGSVERDDLDEFCDKVHQLQHTVMAQAAARAYPDMYRRVGKVFETIASEQDKDESGADEVHGRKEPHGPGTHHGRVRPAAHLHQHDETEDDYPRQDQTEVQFRPCSRTCHGFGPCPECNDTGFVFVQTSSWLD